MGLSKGKSLVPQVTSHNIGDKPYVMTWGTVWRQVVENHGLEAFGRYTIHQLMLLHCGMYVLGEEDPTLVIFETPEKAELYHANMD